MCGARTCIILPWGSWRTKSIRDLESCQTDSVQNFLLSGCASSEYPISPGRFVKLPLSLKGEPDEFRNHSIVPQGQERQKRKVFLVALRCFDAQPRHRRHTLRLYQAAELGRRTRRSFPLPASRERYTAPPQGPKIPSGKKRAALTHKRPS